MTNYESMTSMYRKQLLNIDNIIYTQCYLLKPTKKERCYKFDLEIR